MPQISIVIPYFGDDKKLEATLVSVLENRPYQCEIIVTHAGDYSDPYDLADEVKFVEIAHSDNHLGTIIGQIVHEVQAPVLHLLSCGAQVRQGWTNEVSESFDDPYVGSVCPILLNSDGSVCCIGVENSLLYHNRLLAKGKFLTPQEFGAYEPVGPTQFAGFYRVEALREITCIDQFSDSLFGLETALSLEAIGYEDKVLSSCTIELTGDIEIASPPRDTQTALWRFAGSLGLAQGLALSTLGILKDVLGSPFSGTSRKSLFNRLSQFIDLKTSAAFREFVEHARGPVLSGQTIPITSHEMPLTGAVEESERRAA